MSPLVRSLCLWSVVAATGCISTPTDTDDRELSGVLQDGALTVFWEATEGDNDTVCFDFDVLSLTYDLASWSAAITFDAPTATVPTNEPEADATFEIDEDPGTTLTITPTTPALDANTDRTLAKTITWCGENNVRPEDLVATTEVAEEADENTRYETIVDEQDQLALISLIEPKDCLLIRLVNLTGFDMAAWEVQVQLQQPSELWSVDGMTLLLNEDKDVWTLKPNVGRQEIPAYGELDAYICGEPRPEPVSITTYYTLVPLE